MNDDRPLNASVTILTNAGDQATLENIPVSVIQAMYHDITGKTETISRSYIDSFIITHEDIVQLTIQIKQFCEQFTIAGYSETVTVEHYGTKEKISFSSIDKFRTYQTSIKEPTYQLALTVNFLISNPNYGKYQNYRIDVDINSYKLLKNSSNLRYHFDRGRPAIVSKVEYVDYTLGRSFSDVIERWSSNLDRLDINRRPELFEKLEEMPNSLFAMVAAVLFLTSMPLAFTIIKIFKIERLASPTEIIAAIYITLATSGLAYFIARIVSEFVEYKMWLHGNFCFTIINDGDKRNYEFFKAKNLRIQSRYNYIIFGVIAASVINITSSTIYDYIKSVFG